LSEKYFTYRRVMVMMLLLFTPGIVDKYPGNLIKFRKAFDFLCYAVGVGVLSTSGTFATTFCLRFRQAVELILMIV
jgi:hypothetical protein